MFSALNERDPLGKPSPVTSFTLEKLWFTLKNLEGQS
jgi:hypothetical protein